MELLASDIRTQEVLHWKGLHLIHFRFSACSQKTRIFLNLKGADWQSHHLNLAKQQNYEDWFLGINPRGLVPVLVHDGVVHIESNDILAYLERVLPTPPLIPESLQGQITAGLKEENDLHLDLRTLTMGFLSPQVLVRKKQTLMENYQNDAGKLRGEADPHKPLELKFWQDFAKTGITPMQATAAADKFAHVYRRLDQDLSDQRYLAGDNLTLLDIAWFIYTHRLNDAGYPFETLHPHVHKWFEHLMQKPEFAKEVAQPTPMKIAVGVFKKIQKLQGQTLPDLMQRAGLLNG